MIKFGILNPLSYIAGKQLFFQIGHRVHRLALDAALWRRLRPFYRGRRFKPGPVPVLPAEVAGAWESAGLLITGSVEEFLRRERRIAFFDAGEVNVTHLLIAATRAGIPWHFQHDGRRPVALFESHRGERLSPRGTAAYLGHQFLNESLRATALCVHKMITQHLLELWGYRVARQVPVFRSELQGGPAFDGDEAIARLVFGRHGAPRDFPLVVKPENLRTGAGVTAVKDVAALGREVRRLFKALPRLSHELGEDAGSCLLVEEMLSGPEHRVFVLADGFVAALERLRFTIRGDGRSTARKLIDKENEKRLAIAWERRYLRHVGQLSIDAAVKDRLRNAGLALDRPVPAGRSVVLASVANLGQGGLTRTVDRPVAPPFRRRLVDLLRRLGVDRVGFDMMGGSLARPPFPFIVELNTPAAMSPHLEPDAGEPQPVALRTLEYFLKKGISDRDAVRLRERAEAEWRRLNL